VGRGSTFHFTARFWLADAAAAAPQPPAEVAVRGLRVLVVDDTLANRRILEEMLSGWGMKPTGVTGAREALANLRRACARGRPYALVLLDASMPELDGFETAARMRKDPALAGIPIILLTSAGQRGDAARCRRVGIAGYLIKPARPSEIFDAVMAVLGPRGAAGPARLVTRHSLREKRTGRRVLLVEDNPVNQAVALRLLEKRGHVVTVANHGEEALALFEPGSFDVILMDVQMPRLGGVETTAVIRERERRRGGHVPIIAMTAHAMKGDRERCLAAGMDDYLSKPIQPEELYEAIDRALRRGALVPPDRAAAGSGPPPAASGGRAGAPFDRDAALARVDHDRALFAEITGLFLRTAPERLQAVRAALDRGDASAAARATHALRGAIANFEARPAGEAAGAVEDRAAAGDLDGARRACPGLVRETGRLIEALEREAKEHAA
jgi:CheY-like chemotaxis protein/HPt (histidine-containing phosphotransfer) domain-containing protein